MTLCKRKSRKQVFLLSLCVSFLLLFFFFLAHHRNWQDLRDTLSYSTRPLWDRPDGPTQIIPRLHAEGLGFDAESTCQRHAWKVRNPKPFLLDAVLFSTEVDLLRVRLKELEDVVDVFVVAESTHNLMGEKRNLTFAASRDKFTPWAAKIRYYLHQGRQMEVTDGPFTLVNEMRQGVTKFIYEEVKPPSGSLISMADVDEIPSKATMELIKGCHTPLPIHLQMQNYIYSFEWATDARSWRAQVHRVGDGSPYMHGKASDVALGDAGWHCSFCFRHLHEFAQKMKGASHADRLYNRLNWPSLLSPQRIQEKICTGEDLFDMLPEAYTWSELIRLWKGAQRTLSIAHLPLAVVQDPRHFAFLLPGGCIRES